MTWVSRLHKLQIRVIAAAGVVRRILGCGYWPLQPKHWVCQVFSVTDLSGGDSVFEKDGKLVEGFPPFFDRFGPLFSDVL